MAKGPRTVLALPDGIAAHRDLPDSAEIEPLPGGYHNDVLRLCEVVVRLEPEGLRRAASGVLRPSRSHFTLTQGRPHRDWVDDLLSELRALP